jgi:hypothetical protein
LINLELEQGKAQVISWTFWEFLKEVSELGNAGYTLILDNDYFPSVIGHQFIAWFASPSQYSDTEGASLEISAEIPAATLNILYTEGEKDGDQKCDVAALLSLSEEEAENTPTESGQSTESANTPPLSEQKDAEVPLENVEDKQLEDSKDEVSQTGESEGGEQKEETDAVHQANKAVNMNAQPKQRGRPRGR